MVVNRLPSQGSACRLWPLATGKLLLKLKAFPPTPRPWNDDWQLKMHIACPFGVFSSFSAAQPLGWAAEKLEKTPKSEAGAG